MREARTGIVWRCDPAGVLRDVAAPGFRPADRADAGRSFSDAVDPASSRKAQTLLQKLRTDGIALNWELNVSFDGRTRLLHCDAADVGDELLVVGALKPSDAAALFRDALPEAGGPRLPLLHTLARERISYVDPAHDLADTLYEELSRLNNELTAAQRDLVRQNLLLGKLNEQKNYFLGMAAHELRNPLSTIRFYSDFLRQHADRLTAEEQRRMLTSIFESSGFMARLIDDLLTVSKIEAGHLDLDVQDIDLVELAAHSVALNHILAEKKHIALHLDAAVPHVPCRADGPKLEQVINNLLTNAIKFSQEGTEVHVRVAPHDGEVVLAVEDHGPGIPSEDLDKLFQPFEKTSVKTTAGERSTGLGLSISRRIVEGHHGRLWVESRVGRGSTFYVALPVEKEE